MNKRQKAIRDKQPGHIMSGAEWEFATDDFKHLRKKKKMDNIQFKEYRDIISEGKFSKSLIAKAVKIAKKSGGQMTKAWKAIEKIKKGLGDDPTVADALRVANEEVQAEGVDVVEQQESIEVAVQEDGSYLVNGIALASSNAAELTSLLQQEAGSNRQLLFVIAADANATHQSVVQVMDVAGKLGFLNINISTVVPLGQPLPP